VQITSRVSFQIWNCELQVLSDMDAHKLTPQSRPEISTFFELCFEYVKDQHIWQIILMQKAKGLNSLAFRKQESPSHKIEVISSIIEC
jgi:hypothetical protein